MKEKSIKIMGFLNLMSEFKLYGVIAILYYVQVTNSMALAMSIFSIATISSCIFEIPTGIISDKIGRKKTIILGSISSLTYIVILGIAENYIELIIASLFNGLEIAFFSGNNQAYIYDLIEKDKKEQYKVYMGKVNSMIYLAGAVSAMIGTFIVNFTSFRFVIFLTIVPKALQLMCSFLLEDVVEEKNKESILQITKEAIVWVKNNNILRMQIIADGINDGIGEACFQFRSTFYALVWPEWALGIPGVLSNIGAFIANWFSGKIMERIGTHKLYVISNIYSILSNCVGVFTKNIYSPIIMTSNSLFTTEVIQIDIEQKLYNEKYRASMGSIKSFAKNVIFSIIAVILGILADYIGIINAFIIFQCLKFIPIILYKKIFYNSSKMLCDTNNSQ